MRFFALQWRSQNLNSASVIKKNLKSQRGHLKFRIHIYFKLPDAQFPFGVSHVPTISTGLITYYNLQHRLTIVSDNFSPLSKYMCIATVLNLK